MNLSAQRLSEIYSDDTQIIKEQIDRYNKLKDNFVKKYGTEPTSFFRSPGRTEIAGNHTDHNHGKVLAAGINLDTIAAVSENDDKIVRVYSEDLNEAWEVNLDQLEPRSEEKETTSALVRGIAARFVELGLNVAGFDAYIKSDVLVGSGLSSSASVEVLIGTIFNSLFNHEKLDPVEIAKAGQYAENKYFGKPCGLMDQIACAVGGVVKIDFELPDNPKVEKINMKLRDYSLLVVDTGGSHADLTEDYASIPAEMKSVAACFNKEVCRSISQDDIINKLPELRKNNNDRALLRALHFQNENVRVDKMIRLLESSQFDNFLDLFKASGNSSFKYLQNCYSVNNVTEQGVSLALALSEMFLTKYNAGAARVHGGGFAGTIQVFIKKEMLSDFTENMENVFGAGSVIELQVLSTGACRL